MKDRLLLELIKIARIHVSRINYARLQLKKYFPISAKIMAVFSDTELTIFELYISRFCKLQDLLGQRIFTIFIELVSDTDTETMTFIDKTNKLEKLGVIENARDWQFIRSIRNHLTHEYPDHQEKNCQLFEHNV